MSEILNTMMHASPAWLRRSLRVAALRGRRAYDAVRPYLATAPRGVAGRYVHPHGAPPRQRLVVFDKEWCPYSRLVRETLTELDLDAVMFPCPDGAREHRRRLENLGGSARVPYLVDSDTETRLHDAGDIIQYLYERYGLPGTDARSMRPSPGDVARSRITTWIARPRDEHGRVIEAPPEQLLVLWSLEASPACRRVREHLCELAMPYILHNVGVDSGKRRRLTEARGRFEVPMLEDPNTGRVLAGAEDILDYLEAVYDTRPRGARPRPDGLPLAGPKTLGETIAAWQMAGEGAYGPVGHFIARTGEPPPELRREPTLLETLTAWNRAGYRGNLIARGGELIEPESGAHLVPESFTIDSIARFDGQSDPKDQVVAIALRHPVTQLRGVFVSGYGPGVEADDLEVLDRLQASHSPHSPPLPHPPHSTSGAPH